VRLLRGHFLRFSHYPAVQRCGTAFLIVYIKLPTFPETAEGEVSIIVVEEDVRLCAAAKPAAVVVSVSGVGIPPSASVRIWATTRATAFLARFMQHFFGGGGYLLGSPVSRVRRLVCLGCAVCTDQRSRAKDISRNQAFLSAT
jgi:hypothetical protein